MNITQCKKWLRKATMLLEAHDPAGQELSDLEVALLKSYLIQAFDATQSDTAPSPSSNKANTSMAASDRHTSPPVETVTATATPQPKAVSFEPSTVVATAPAEVKSAVAINKNIEAILELHKDQLKEGHIGSRSISDINKAIGLNDRLQFVKHLFSGDQQAMQKATAQLNSLDDNVEVATYLSTLSTKYEWDRPDKQDVLSSFLYLVARKTAQN